MHYAICNDFSANQLGFSKNLCIMRIMHCDGMHYEKVYCIDIHGLFNSTELAFLIQLSDTSISGSFAGGRGLASCTSSAL